MRTRRKQLSAKEELFMKYISDNELSYFKFNTIRSLGIYNSSDELQDTLSRLSEKGMIDRIERGLYCVRNFRNTFVIANAMQQGSAVAYWTALNLHGLTEQIPNMIYSQTSMLKQDKTVFNVRYKFIKVKQEKIFGIMQMGYGSEVFSVTDMEKTLLDCFDLPQHAGGYDGLIRALYSAEIDPVKLLRYGQRMSNLSVLKRIAFLSELFQMDGFVEFQQGVLGMMNQKHALLDPSGNDTGPFDAKWRIRINISKENLWGIVNNIY
jgi:predicted transcriptional regulator of viral defense system